MRQHREPARSENECAWRGAGHGHSLQQMDIVLLTTVSAMLQSRSEAVKCR